MNELNKHIEIKQANPSNNTINKNILITGNGFDKAHGLRTGYSDFVDFLKSLKSFFQEIDSNKCINSDGIISDSAKELFLKLDTSIPVFLKNNNYNWKELCMDIRDCFQTNMWLEYFILKYNPRKKLWSDLEIISENTLKQIYSNSKNIGICVDEDEISPPNTIANLLKILHCDNAKEIRLARDTLLKETSQVEVLSEHLWNDYVRFEKLLEIYLYMEFTAKTKKDMIEEFKYLLFDYIVNFNYTDTYRIIYGEMLLSEEQIDFIHGKARYKEGENILVGIPDEDNGSDFINQYQKCIQRMSVSTDREYVNFIERNNPMGIDTYFYGHSMAVSDKTILVDLLPDVGTDTRINKSYIFCHGGQKNKNRIVRNVREILGENRFAIVVDKQRRVEFLTKDEWIEKFSPHMLLTESGD